MTVHVHLLPSLFEPSDLAGSTAVMIDVLRASTTITTALANGAVGVRPYADVEETRAAASELGTLTGGERGGMPLPGFDFGNSPSSYTTEQVSGREICFTTTNGTAALTKMNKAADVRIGAFVNLSAVVELLAASAGDVHLVCAGTDGQLTSEDVLFAGAVASALEPNAMLDLPLGTQLAKTYYETHGSNSADLRAAVRAGQGGSNLIRLGLETDIDDAITVDRFDRVPRLVDGVIT